MDALTPNPDLYNVPNKAAEFHSMPYRYLGSSGLQAPSVGLGTWKFGFPETDDGARVDPDEAARIMDHAWELGVLFWDTANRYNASSGNSERLIGRWLAAHPERRRDVVLATKTYGGMDGSTPNHAGLSRLQITESVKASLQRLQTDWIDVLWFHRFDENVPLAESLEAVEDLVRQGQVRYLAVSNFSAAQLSECLQLSEQISRRVRPVAVQNQFDPLDGERLPGVLDLCVREGVTFVPYSPLARGLLTDRYLDPAKVGPGDRLVDEGTFADLGEEKLASVRRLGELAKDWHVKVSKLTLAYILTLPGMGTQIPSSSSTDQLADNAAAATLELSEDQRAALRDVFGR